MIGSGPQPLHASKAMQTSAPLQVMARMTTPTV
jgi:hypothetical protein